MGSTAGKKINGRKRHIFVDTQGNILYVCVLPAHIADSDGAYDVLDGIHQRYPNITMMWADGAYGANVDFFADMYTITVEITKNLIMLKVLWLFLDDGSLNEHLRGLVGIASLEKNTHTA